MAYLGLVKKVQTKCNVTEEIKQLRSVVRDAMHFTVFFGRTHCKRRMCGLVVIFSSKVQEWCHSQAVTLKTASTNRSWVVEQLRGAFMQPLKGTMQLLTTEHVLEDFGLPDEVRSEGPPHLLCMGCKAM